MAQLMISGIGCGKLMKALAPQLLASAAEVDGGMFAALFPAGSAHGANASQGGNFHGVFEASPLGPKGGQRPHLQPPGIPKEETIRMSVEELGLPSIRKNFEPNDEPSFSSSVARARLVAALNHDGIPGSSRWPVAISLPGPDPVENLAVALSRAVNVGQGASALADLIAELQSSEKALHLTIRQSLSENSSDMRLIVLVDQFEELFTLCRKEELREALVRNLLDAARVVQGQTLVILTMRAGFYAKCAANAELAAAFSDHHVLVGPMSEDELCRAIRTANAFGRR